MELYRLHGLFAMNEYDNGIASMQGGKPLDVELVEILANGVLAKLGRNQIVVDVVDTTATYAEKQQWYTFHMKIVDKSNGS